MFEALEEIHSVTGHIHSDIKTENFRVHNGSVYLIDFGLVKEFMKEGRHIEAEQD
jgi:tRNA A-37 threonylcarbamoyl transferase component Bud32